MCFAIPGKVIEINGEDVIVDYDIEKRHVKDFMNDVCIGDYVVVSNKVIVMKVPPEQAKDYINSIKNVRENVNQ